MEPRDGGRTGEKTSESHGRNRDSERIATPYLYSKLLKYKCVQSSSEFEVMTIMKKTALFHTPKKEYLD